MLFLICNILFASIFMLTIKWVQVRQREDVITVGCINYIVAALAFLPEFLITDEPIVTVNSMWTGCMMGTSYFIAYFFVIYAIKWIGASASTVLSSLSLLVPIICGVYIWGERPNTFQVFGVGLSLLALVLIGGKTNSDTAGQPKPNGRQGISGATWFRPLVLIIFFALCGCSRLAQEAFKHVCDEAQRPTFIVAAFVTAAIPSIVVLLARRKRIHMSELSFGFLMGMANVLQTHFILKSLDRYDGFIVFPVVGAGSLMFTAVVATGVLGERLNRKTVIGIAIACIALILLNWIPG